MTDVTVEACGVTAAEAVEVVDALFCSTDGIIGRPITNLILGLVVDIAAGSSRMTSSVVLHVCSIRLCALRLSSLQNMALHFTPDFLSSSVAFLADRPVSSAELRLPSGKSWCLCSGERSKASSTTALLTSFN